MAKQNLTTSISLQPRKKAKTAEEKEQRRIERILRNRKAAHKSRVRKRFYLDLYQKKSEKYDKLLDMLIKHNVLNSNQELNKSQSFKSLTEEIFDLNSKQSLFEKENGTVNSSIPKKDDDESDIKRHRMSSDSSEFSNSPESSTTTLKDVKVETEDLDYFVNSDNVNFVNNLDLDLELGIGLDADITDIHNLTSPLFPIDNDSLTMQQRYPAEITQQQLNVQTYDMWMN